MICNLCGGNEFRTIEKTPIHLVICRDCGLLFIKNTQESGFYKELYTKHYNSQVSEDDRDIGSGNRNVKNVKWIKRHLNARDGLRFLEIGCGFGSFLESLKSERFEVYGIEPGEQAAKYASNKIGPSYIENCFLEETKLPGNFFDVVLLVQTFEHFTDPTKSLHEIRRLLKDEGLLFIEVPDAFSIGGVYRWGLEPSANHLFIYSVATIKLLLNKCGFDVCALRKTSVNINIVAKKGRFTNPDHKKYKSNFNKTLLANYINKFILRTIIKFNLTGTILRSKIIRKLLDF